MKVKGATSESFLEPRRQSGPPRPQHWLLAVDLGDFSALRRHRSLQSELPGPSRTLVRQPPHCRSPPLAATVPPAAIPQQDSRCARTIFYDYTTNYSYDDLGQLTAAVHNDNALVDLTMTYDPNGNILTQNNRTYDYISGTNKVKNTDGSGNDYTYNANGNMIKSFPKNIRQIKYDAFTQMTRSIRKWALFADKLSFQYDGTNRRVFKKRAYYVNPSIPKETGTPNEEVQG